MSWSDELEREVWGGDGHLATSKAFDNSKPAKRLNHAKILDGQHNGAEIEKLLKSKKLLWPEREILDDPAFEEKRRREAEALRLSHLDEGEFDEDGNPLGFYSTTMLPPTIPCHPSPALITRRRRRQHRRW